MSKRVAKIYSNSDAETSVQSLSSGQLIVLIYERIFDNLRLGKHALENGEHGIDAFTKAHDLIQQGLLACIDFKAGGDIALNLSAIYEWSLREIINARVTNSPQKVQEIIEILMPLYEAWIALAPKEAVRSLASPSSLELVSGVR
jgi:flagellar protein FliS